MSTADLQSIQQLERRLTELKQRLARLRAACVAVGVPQPPPVTTAPTQLQRWRAGAAAAALLRALSCAVALFDRAAHDADSDAESVAGPQLQRMAEGMQRLAARHAGGAVLQLARAARHRVGQRRAARLTQQLELVRWPHHALLPAPPPAPVDWAPVRLAAVPLLPQPARLAAALAAPLQLRFQFAARASNAARIGDALHLLPPLVTAARQIITVLGFEEQALLRLIVQRLVATVIERLRQILQRDSEMVISQRSVLSIGDTLHAAHRELELVSSYIPKADEPCLFDCFSPAMLGVWKEAVRTEAVSQLVTSLKSPLAWERAFQLNEWESLPDPCAVANAARDFIAVLLSAANRLRYFPVVDFTHGLLAELIHYMVDHMSAAANDIRVPSGLATQLLLMNSTAALASYLHDWTSRIRKAEASEEDLLLELVVADRGTAQILEDGALHFEDLGRSLRKNVLSCCLVALSSSLEPYLCLNTSEDSDEKRLIRASIAVHGAELAAIITSTSGAETRASLLRSLCTAVEELIQSRQNVQQLRLLLLPLFSSASSVSGY